MNCPTCQQPDLRIFRNAVGFDPAKHCQINRANFGKLSLCPGNIICEQCRFFQTVTEWKPVGIGGRMQRVIRKDLLK